MARRLAARLVVKGELRATSALHVGGAEDGVGIDLPLARDGCGRLYVPGTSLAGAFRSWWVHAFGEPSAKEVWGHQDEGDGDGGDGRGLAGHASHILVDDGPVTLPKGVKSGVRDSAGIDREWGSAAPHVKYDRAVLPTGSLVELSVTAELADPAAGKAKAMIGHLLAALEAGEVRLGAARTRGLGRVRGQDLTIREQRMESREGVFELLEAPTLRDWGTTISVDELRAADGTLELDARAKVEVSVEWHPAGPLMVRAGGDGFAIDSLPLVELGLDGLALLLPGSSVKGILRSQAERIIRTLLDVPAQPGGIPPTMRFLNQLDLPLVEWLFGTAARAETGDESSTLRPEDVGQANLKPGLAALSVEDCTAAEVLDREGWAAVLEAGDQDKALKALAAAGAGGWSPAFHVAIDRWTGSAAKALLFSVLEPHGVRWNPITLRVDLERIPEPLRQPALALLLLLLDDLAEGRLPLGFATNRGMGSVKVDRIRIATTDPATLGIQGEGASTLTLEGGVLDELDAATKRTLGEAWRNWLSEERERRAR